MKDYALFLGCTVPVRGLHYEASARKTAERLGIRLVDLKEFSCCGFPLEGADHLTSLAMAAMNIAAAERREMDIVTLCSACTATLTKANKQLKEDEALRKEVNRVLAEVDAEFKGTRRVKHYARLLAEDIGYEKIKASVKNPLNGLRIAPHYGCHYLKPSEIYEGFDSPERPVTLDRLLEAIGATPVDYEDKLQCCGGGILGIDELTSLKMTQQKLQHIKETGADAMTFICPFCAVMYDLNQKAVETKVGGKYNLPGIYYPQLLGIAMGFTPQEMAIHLNRVKVNLKFGEAKA
ncbi:MAG: CoB--CoM heterodisulfide reductase iron-sulfur subunit B family protein [Thermoplasmatota archaeon]